MLGFPAFNYVAQIILHVLRKTQQEIVRRLAGSICEQAQLTPKFVCQAEVSDDILGEQNVVLCCELQKQFQCQAG